MIVKVCKTISRKTKICQTNYNQQTNSFKDRTRRSSYLPYLLFLILLITLCIPTVKAQADNSLNIRYNGENVTYTGKKVWATYNGKNISMKGTPGIVINGYSMVSVKNAFSDAGMKASYTYSKNKGTVTLVKNDITLVMTIGSTKATINGKAVTMPIAPIKVTYKDQGVTKILVPTTFVTESLGYSYNWTFDTSNIYAAISTPLKISYNGSVYDYTDTRGYVTVDGKNVSLGYMPNIKINNTYFTRAKKMASAIGATYSYNKSTKKVTLTKGNIKVELTLGENVSYINGNAHFLDASPRVVKNINQGTSYVMIPISAISSYFGYDSSWDTKTNTIALTLNKDYDESIWENETDDNTTKPSEPELGDDSLNETDRDNVYYQYTLSENFKSDYETYQNVVPTTLTGTNVMDPGYIYNIAQSNITPTKEEYIIQSTKPFGNIYSSSSDNTITITANNSMYQEQTLTFENSIVNSLYTIFNTADNSTNMVISLADKTAKYQLELSEDLCTLKVIVYYNYLTGLTFGKDSSGEYIELTGKNLDPTVTESSNGMLTISLPYIVNGIDEQMIQTDKLSNITFFMSTNTNQITTVFMEKALNQGYYITKNENSYRLTFTNTNTDNSTDNDSSSYSMQIPLPTGITSGMVTDRDLYYNNQFEITIPGDYVSYYLQNQIVKNNKKITDVSVKLVSGNTVITVTTSTLQGYKLSFTSKYINVIVDNPRNVYKNIVVLDAGHGGTDPGAIYNKVYESTINFEILYNKAAKYFNSPTSNIKVYYTRYNNTKIDLYDRAAFAKKVGADLFVSLHMNAAANTSAYGTEVYYSTYNTSTMKGLSSSKLASLLVNGLSDSLGSRNRGTYDKKLIVCRYNTVPAVLIELGFMSNSNDFSLMTNSDYQEKTAKAIYETLENVFAVYPTGR